MEETGNVLCAAYPLDDVEPEIPALGNVAGHGFGTLGEHVLDEAPGRDEHVVPVARFVV
jgi:hypothetical protein